MDKRPQAIVMFEWLMIASQFLSVIQLGLTWAEISKAASAFTSPALIMAFQVMGMAIMLVLTLLVSRGRARFARYLVLALALLCMPGYVMLLYQSFGEHDPIKTLAGVNIAVQIMAIVMLMLPDAGRWVKEA